MNKRFVVRVVKSVELNLCVHAEDYDDAEDIARMLMREEIEPDSENYIFEEVGSGFAVMWVNNG